MKTLPDRAGITFTVGAQLEARDKQDKWCSGTIKQVDPENGQVLVQYRRWSKRIQEWFNWDSPHIRGLDRISLRRTGLNQTTEPLYRAGCKVMACWTDCKFYPAKILRVNHKDDSYTVRFYDGVVRTIRLTKIKPYDQKWKEENSSEEWDEDSDSETERETAREGQKDTGHKDLQQETGDILEDKERTKEAGEQGLGDMEGTMEAEDEDLRDKEAVVQGQGGVKTEIKEEQSQDLETKETAEERKEVDKKVESKERGRKDIGNKGLGNRQRKRRTEHLKEVPSKRKRINDRKHQPITEEYSSPGPAYIDRDVLLERQAHLPTTHKFSREPLYRVIKRQPPPILSIDLDHNQFKCPAPDCGKSFRKSSLLHCHLKYYHSTTERSTTDRRTADRKKGLSPESKPDLSTCRSGDQEAVTLETGGTDCVALETGPGPKRDPDLRRNRKHFLRVKLKKKKKKKKKRRKRSHTGFCSSDDENTTRPSVSISLDSVKHEEGSDWSTLTAESGEDSSSWPVAAETDRCDVRCVCEVTEVNDYMKQCTRCRSWQHSSCLGLYENQVPQNYTCFTCRPSSAPPHHFSAPPHDYSSTPAPDDYSKHSHNYSSRAAPDWSRDFARVAPDWSRKSSTVAPDWSRDSSRQASDWARDSSRQARDWSRGSVLRRRLWSDWSRCRRTLVSDWLRSGHMSGLSCVNSNYSEENSEQISLTHTLLSQVQTVGALSAGVGLKLRLLQSGSEAELRFWRFPWRREEEEGPKVVCYVNSEHCYTTPAQLSPERVQAEPDQDLRPLRASGTDQSPELNLLDHIESLQQEICKRLERMETELDGLESWLDELESPDRLCHLPDLKQRIRRLLRDLSLVRQLSISV